MRSHPGTHRWSIQQANRDTDSHARAPDLRGRVWQADGMPRDLCAGGMFLFTVVTDRRRPQGAIHEEAPVKIGSESRALVRPPE